MSNEEEQKSYTMKIEERGVTAPNLIISANDKGVEFILNSDLSFNTLLYSEDILKGLQQEFTTAIKKFITIQAKNELRPDIMKVTNK
jgi:S-adenosylhomocysteine hydrolase